MVEFDQMCFNFNIVSPAVHILRPLVLQHMDSRGIEALILILIIALNCRYDIIFGPIHASQPSLFHDGEQKIVRWCQIRRIWRIINQFKATFTHSSHCNHRLVCRSIVLVKQDSLRQFFGISRNVSSTNFHNPKLLHPVWVYLEGNNAVSSSKGWI